MRSPKLSEVFAFLDLAYPLAPFIAAAASDTTVEDLLVKLLGHLDQAVTRPGSWQRDCFWRMFPEIN